MACNKCNKTECGCGDRFIDVSPNFSNNPESCPVNSEKCSELYDMACICYNGEDIVEFDIKKGDRLDVIMQKLLLIASNPGCATWGNTSGTNCEAPISLTVTNITDTTIDLMWSSVPSATSYTIEYKTATALSWNITPSVTVTSGSLIGLLPDTIYDIRINAACSLGSCYSLTYRLKTKTNN